MLSAENMFMASNTKFVVFFIIFFFLNFDLRYKNFCFQYKFEIVIMFNNKTILLTNL